MKFVFALFLTVLFYPIKGQNLKYLDCVLLEKSFNTEIFKKHFFICKYPNEPLIIVDTNKYFSDCTLPLLCERKVRISRIWPTNVDINRGSSKETINLIILSDIKVNNGSYTIHFWQPCNNGSLILELRQKRQKIKIKTISYGVY
ncbi:MAG: hypothetical protein HY951_00625 [Bacteroidia bacterium]|nr:hypothetical protein [Bacteroidia bacterium]